MIFPSPFSLKLRPLPGDALARACNRRNARGKAPAAATNGNPKWRQGECRPNRRIAEGVRTGGACRPNRPIADGPGLGNEAFGMHPSPGVNGCRHHVIPSLFSAAAELCRTGCRIVFRHRQRKCNLPTFPSQQDSEIFHYTSRGKPNNITLVLYNNEFSILPDKQGLALSL